MSEGWGKLGQEVMTPEALGVSTLQLRNGSLPRPGAPINQGRQEEVLPPGGLCVE